MFRNYLQLNNDKKEELIEFIIKNENEGKKKEEVKKEIENCIYNYGEGVIAYIHKNKIVSTAFIVLKEAITLNCCYIHSIIIDSIDENEENVLFTLIEHCTKVALNHNATKVFLGLMEEKYNYLMHNRGLNYSYKAVEMYLENKSLKQEIELLDVIQLDDSNKSIYQSVINDAFSDMPHGATTTNEQVEEYIDIQKRGKDYFYIVYLNNQKIGFINVELDEKSGIFDIGLCKEFRGSGLGKRILETAISIILENNKEDIKLIVIEKNTSAYSMYISRGFKVKNVINYWYEIF